MREGIRYDWIIAVSNSAESGIKILKTYCKVSEIKQILVDLAKETQGKMQLLLSMVLMISTSCRL